MCWVPPSSNPCFSATVRPGLRWRRPYWGGRQARRAVVARPPPAPLRHARQDGAGRFAAPEMSMITMPTDQRPSESRAQAGARRFPVLASVLVQCNGMSCSRQDKGGGLDRRSEVWRFLFPQRLRARTVPREKAPESEILLADPEQDGNINAQRCGTLVTERQNQPKPMVVGPRPSGEIPWIAGAVAKLRIQNHWMRVDGRAVDRGPAPPNSALVTRRPQVVRKVRWPAGPRTRAARTSASAAGAYGKHPQD